MNDATDLFASVSEIADPAGCATTVHAHDAIDPSGSLDPDPFTCTTVFTVAENALPATAVGIWFTV